MGGRVLRGEGLDSAVRGDAAGRGLYGGGTVNRRGGAWRASDCGLPHEAVEVRRDASRHIERVLSDMRGSRVPRYLPTWGWRRAV